MSRLYFSIIYFAVCAASISSLSCRTQSAGMPRANDEMPTKILWAWERTEDLRFLDARRFGVAFLAQTLILRDDDVIFRPRRQPLELPDNIYLIAVTRIESDRQNSARPALSDAQMKKIVALVGKSIGLPNVKAVQIDFDAAASERNFYKNLIVDLKTSLPQNFPLTITALASWCIEKDAWFAGLPIDEAVPMAFRMGDDTTRVRSFLASGSDWNAPLCRASEGVSLDEPFAWKHGENRRVFYFNSRAWQPSDLERIK